MIVPKTATIANDEINTTSSAIFKSSCGHNYFEIPFHPFTNYSWLLLLFRLGGGQIGGGGTPFHLLMIYLMQDITLSPEVAELFYSIFIPFFLR